jgi:hypothetical protein
VRYLKAAALINRWIGGDRTVEVGCTEIGIFGYYFKGRILDTYGLVSPEALRVENPQDAQRLPNDSREFPVNVLMLERPEVVMMAQGFALQRSKSFADVYEAVPDPGVDLQIYVRRDRKDLMPKHDEHQHPRS